MLSRTQPQLIVLHLMGSRPQACDRTKGKYAVFRAVERDLLLSLHHDANRYAVEQSLYSATEFGETFSMTYFPITVWPFKERGKRCSIWHTTISTSRIPVPFMVISSDDKAHKIIKARRSANDFLSFFSQWTGISAQEITPRYRFISERRLAYLHHQLPAEEGRLHHLGTDAFTVN